MKEIPEIDEPLDFEKLRAENYKKYRELYKELNNLGSRAYQPINKDALNKIRSSELYLEALKTGFFVEKFTDSIRYLAIGTDTVELLRKDISKVSEKEDGKYKELLCYLESAPKRILPDPKKLIVFVICGIVAAFIVVGFIFIGMLTQKALFFLIGVILLFIFMGVGAFLRITNYHQ